MEWNRKQFFHIPYSTKVFLYSVPYFRTKKLPTGSNAMNNLHLNQWLLAMVSNHSQRYLAVSSHQLNESYALLPQIRYTLLYRGDKAQLL